MPLTITPALRHRDADKNPLLLAIWKFFSGENLRRIKSRQTRAEPRTQATQELASHPTERVKQRTGTGHRAHHPSSEVAVGNHASVGISGQEQR